jgi:DNA-3-methyladenine glycosylase II
MQTVRVKNFDYGQRERDYLISCDETLGAAIKRLGKVEREVIPDLFAALVHAVVGQLISAKAVQTIWNRMQETFGEITAANLSNFSFADIQSCGITMKKAICIKSIAETIEQGEFDLMGLYNLPDIEVIKRLSDLKGIGKWTAEMLLINSMERQDVVSFGDLAIKRGMLKLYGLTNITKEQFDKYKARYSPYGSVASIYLWRLSFE